jgi:hypothetical protein
MRLSWPLGPLIPEAGGSLAHGSPNGRAIRPLFSSCAGGRVMDKSMKAFVERQNVEHYVDQLKTETDPVKRNVVLKLLAEEEVKQVKAST